MLLVSGNNCYQELRGTLTFSRFFTELNDPAAAAELTVTESREFLIISYKVYAKAHDTLPMPKAHAFYAFAWWVYFQVPQ